MPIKEMPLVSILIRSMDRPMLQRAMQSAARQTWENVEIVVIAACGRKHRPLPEQILGRPVRLIHPEPDRKLPRPEAANLALESARGEWLNFLDDDDELFPEHLHTLLDAPRNPDARVLYSRSEVRDATGTVTGHCGFDSHPMRFFYETLMTPNATLFARSLVQEGARFDPAFTVYEDHDFFLNCATRTPIAFIDRATCIWNAHDGESGLGHGANRGTAQRAELSSALRRKWARVFDRWAREPGVLLGLGQHYLKSGDFAAARDCLESALRLWPNDVNALNLCGMANLHHGDAQRAETLLARALALLPTHRGLQENLALIRARRATG